MVPIEELRAFLARNAELLERLRFEMAADDEDLLAVVDALDENHRALADAVERG